MLVAGAFAHDDDVEHGVDEGQAGEKRAARPIEDEEGGAFHEVIGKEGGSPDEQAEAHDQKESAEPSAPRVQRREHS